MLMATAIQEQAIKTPGKEAVAMEVGWHPAIRLIVADCPLLRLLRMLCDSCPP